MELAINVTAATGATRRGCSMGETRRGLRAAIALMATIAACLAFAACGGGSSDDGADDRRSAGESTGVAAAKANLERLYAGTSVPPPSDSPPPAEGKNVWIISLAQNYSPANLTVTATDRAARAMGWRTTVFDGKGNSETFLTGVRQAVASGADGVVMVFIDCALVKSGAREASRAGVTVVGLQTQTCEDRRTSTPAL